MSLARALSRVAEIEARAASLLAVAERLGQATVTRRGEAGGKAPAAARTAAARPGRSFEAVLAATRQSGSTAPAAPAVRPSPAPRAAPKAAGAHAAGEPTAHHASAPADERPLVACSKGYAYPLAVRGEIIGLPYQGTHARFDNWESENAVDIAVPYGTPVYAVADGVIGDQIGPLDSDDPRLQGERLHLVTANDEFYYAHLSSVVVRPGQHVRKGDLIGYSGAANGVEHLHLAAKTGSPADALC